MQTFRSFIGIFPPAALLERLLFVQSTLKPFAPHARWEKESKFHITVEFLGEKSEEWLAQVRNELQTLCTTEKFSIVLTRIGIFPSIHSPKIFWIGSDPVENQQLMKMTENIRKLTEKLGHAPDPKPFHPHMTLGRGKGKINPVLIQNLETVTFHPIEFICGEIRIMRSELASTGSTYTTLYTIPLK